MLAKQAGRPQSRHRVVAWWGEAGFVLKLERLAYGQRCLRLAAAQKPEIPERKAKKSQQIFIQIVLDLHIPQKYFPQNE